MKKSFLTILTALLVCGTVMVGCGTQAQETNAVSASETPGALPTETPSNTGAAAGEATKTPIPAASVTPLPDAPKAVAVPTGKKEPIPAEVRQKMVGISMPETADVTFEELMYLTIPHYDYEGNIKEGHMIIDKTLADEVLEIFAELFEAKFPIARMEPIDEFARYIDDTNNTLDLASMSHNNTSSFCYRSVPNKKTKSLHSYGRAIDINPRTNPYHILSTGEITPANGKEFADRTKTFTGKISHGDVVYQAFISRGWTWGGDWKTEKDYQHFQKKK